MVVVAVVVSATEVVVVVVVVIVVVLGAVVGVGKASVVIVQILLRSNYTLDGIKL